MGNKRGVDLAVFYLKVFPMEIHFSITPPEGMANGQKFVGPFISFVVGEKVSVISQLMRSMTTHDIDAHAAVRERGHRVHLLDKIRGRQESGATGHHELYPLCPHAQGDGE